MKALRSQRANSQAASVSRESPELIRRACGDDLDQVVVLCAEHALYERATFDRAGKREALLNALARERLHLWVVASSEGLLGYAAASLEFSMWQAAEYLHLDCLFLRESARRRGLGAQLITAVADHAHSAGITELQWQTPAWNVNARRFYRRLGAHETDKARFHWRLPELAQRS